MLPLVVLAVGLAADSVRRLRAADDRATQLVADQLSGDVDEALSDRVLALQVLAAPPLLDEGRLADFHRRAQVIRGLLGGELILADGLGHMRLHTGVPFGDALPPLPRPSGRAAVPAAFASLKPAVGDVFIGPVTHKPLVALAVPVVRGDHADLVLLTAIDTQAFAHLIEQAKLPAGWHAVLLDSAGTPITGDTSPTASASSIAPGSAHIERSVDRAPWRLVLDVPAAHRGGALLGAALALGTLIAAATLTGVFAGRLGARRLARGVAALAHRQADSTRALPVSEIEEARHSLDTAESERAAALCDLREAHARFSTLFENAPVAMVLSRIDDLRFVEVNSAFEALSGHSKEAAVGRTSAELGMWADQAMVRQVIAELREHGRFAAIEVQLRRRNGDEVCVALSSCRVEIAGRQHAITMLVDTTPQRQARQALEQHKQELEALVTRRAVELEAANTALAERAAAITDLYDNAPCGYHSLSPEGLMTEVNATELAMLGRTRDEVIGQPALRFLTPASQVLFRERYAEFQRAGQVRDLEYDIVRRDGSTLPVLVSAVMVRDAQGRQVGNRATMVDNSERKAREHEIAQMQLELARRADDALAANRAKSAFLANMSHEIRTPMNAILGLTHLLSRDVSEPAQRQRLCKIDGAARHLLQVINDVLDLSKIEAGKMTLDEADFSLDEVIAGAFQLVSDRAQEKSLELVLDTDHAPGRLRGDPTRLSQALINLLTNAVKFTAEGWVRLSTQLLQRDPDGSVVLRFAVQDTGEGILAQAVPHLFHAFEQADSSTTRRHGGTGLGLALTRHIAHLMGGDVGVDSTPGRGSTFWFTARLREGRSPTPEAPAAVRLADRRALLVDDLPEALSAVRDRLQMLGLEVDACLSPLAALAQVDKASRAGRPYDVLLLDWRMGPPDGIALLGDIRRRLGTGTPPALLISAHDEPALRSQARLAGFDAVLVKPIMASALHDQLVCTLRGHVDGAVPPMPAASVAEAQLRARHAGKRLLLAEDNPINREVALELLSSVGLQVETAENGQQAVDQALAGGFDLVLMDMQMPVLDGLSAARHLRAAGLQSIPIIAMTANAFGEDRDACLEAGMDDHIAKPVDPEHLYVTLLRWLPGGRPGRAN